MIIVSSVKKETEVGITIVHQLLYTGDTVMENRQNPIKEESLEVGNTTEKLNGNKKRVRSSDGRAVVSKTMCQRFDPSRACKRLIGE